jgi:hypothetical protein
MSDKDLKYYAEITGKLKKLINKERLILASRGAIETAALLVLLSFLFVIAEAAGSFSSRIRTFMVFSGLVVMMGFFAYRAVMPFIKAFSLAGRSENHYKAALKVGSFFPSVKDELLNSMQLIAVNAENLVYSAGLVEAAFKQTYEKTRGLDFSSVVKFGVLKRKFFLTISAAIVFIVIALFVPGLNGAAFRLINCNREFIPPARFSFEITPGNARITKGEDVEISVKITGEKPKETLIAIKTDDQAKYEYSKLTIDSAGYYRFEEKAVRSSFNYFVSADKLNSAEYRIETIDRPNIRTLDLTITPPAYTRQPQVQQKDNGNINAMVGSTAEFRLTATKVIKTARIHFTDSTEVKLQVNNREAYGKIRITGDKNYQIWLSDENGNGSLSPVTYSVKAMYDAQPVIEMISPNKDVSLSEDNRLPLYVKISDDFGFSKLVLHYRLSASKYEMPHKDFSSVEIPIDKSKKEIDVNYIWNLSPMNLSTEDVVTYYLEVFDNDVVSGPKYAKTGLFNARIPSLEELLKNADNTQEKTEKDLSQTLKEAQELKKSLDKISQDLKQDKKELTWQEKEKIEKTLDKFEKLQEKVENAGKQIENMKNDLQKNNLLSKETLEKYMELQKLFSELSNDAMKKAMEQMKNMMQKMDRQLTEDAMQNMKNNEEMFQKSLERTINLLKRVQVEQKVDETIKRMEAIEKQQEELEKQAQNSDLNSQQKKNELVKKQEEISKELKRLQEEMKELSEKMSELKDMPKEEMEKNLDELDKQDNQEMSQEASENMKNGDKQKSGQMQKKISSNMKNMKQKMQQMQKSMQQQNQQQAFADMMKILNNLISLSKKQEELKNQSQRLEQNSSKFQQNAQRQSDLKSELERTMNQMSELAQKTFAITPEMGKAMGDSRKQMDRALEALQGRNAPFASSSQGESMKSLNEAASLMKSGMESMMQGGGQGGMMSLMQQLGKMSQMQMQLNNMTQSLQRGMNGQLSPQQQAQMQRLAQQQEMIRKSLDELDKEARKSGKSKTLPGNLENIMKQMQEVVSDMNTEKLNNDLIQKQERILSRLLDAQRSMNERDYEKERESKAGKDFTRESPAALNLNTERGKNKIKDELNKAIQEGYLKDYEELIRKYYEALQKRNVGN